jgi:hypothetical protein
MTKPTYQVRQTTHILPHTIQTTSFDVFVCGDECSSDFVNEAFGVLDRTVRVIGTGCCVDSSLQIERTLGVFRNRECSVYGYIGSFETREVGFERSACAVAAGRDEALVLLGEEGLSGRVDEADLLVPDLI